MITDSLKGLPTSSRRKHNFDRWNFNKKKNCRCKRDTIISPDLEGRKVQESNKKWRKQKTKTKRKSKDPGNDNQKKTFNRELLLERRRARIQRRKEKRLREALCQN